MAFLSLYRKYRPQSFRDLVGQKHVVKTLKNALEYSRIAHAYLFAGPRGTGKTSTAKIYAQALNCVEGPTIEPCGVCEACQMIQSGQSIDVVEIDAASNRGIDEIRDLREKVKFYPSEGTYKVYIIDEVHMLTTGAFNALLKTLEEPPKNVIFILATTEPHKVLDTILSRCQRFDFTLLSTPDIIERLEYICNQEKVDYDKESLNLIATASNGGLRDAISILDQAISFTNSNLRSSEIQEMLGKVDISLLNRFMDNVINRNSTVTLEIINEVIKSGKNISMFVSDLLDFLRQIMLFRECGRDSTIFNFTDESIRNIEDIAKKINTEALLLFLEILKDVERELSFADQPRIVLELAIVKMVSPEAEGSLEDLKTRIVELENKVRDITSARLKETEAQEITIRDNIEKKKEIKSESINNKTQGNKNERDSNKFNLNNVDEKNKDDISDESSFNIDDIRKVWPQILNKIKENSISVQALLVEGKPFKVDGNKVFIQFPDDKKFHKKGAEQQVNLIQKAISQVISSNCQIVFIDESEELSVKKKDNIEVEKSDGINKNNGSKFDSSDDSTVNRVLRIFNGKIIKVNYDILEGK